MNNNPFSSKTYTTTWVQHFKSATQVFSFPFLNGISFFKHPFLPLYTNVGRNMTKGMVYSLDFEQLEREMQNQVLLIYDVPKYLIKESVPENAKTKTERITQYPGFLLDLTPFKDFNHYMSQTFSKSSRYKLNKYKKRLESCFNIRYEMYHGIMDEEQYHLIFERFEDLLRKRFDQKQITNNNLDPKEWDFYKEVSYPMIQAKDAALFVIYDGDQIIGVTLNYVHNNTIIDAITVFDIDYSKFHLGSVNIMKLIEWCLENQFGILDFSKGYFDYKKRWCNLEYKFEYHLIYNRKAILPSAIAIMIKNYFEAKQYLRERNINEKLHRLTFLLRKKSSVEDTNLAYEFLEIEQDHSKEDMVKVDLGLPENYFLKTIVFDYLYLNNESYNDLSVFKQNDLENNMFLFCGKTKTVKVELV